MRAATCRALFVGAAVVWTLALPGAALAAAQGGGSSGSTSGDGDSNAAKSQAPIYQTVTSCTRKGLVGATNVVCGA